MQRFDGDPQPHCSAAPLRRCCQAGKRTQGNNVTPPHTLKGLLRFGEAFCFATISNAQRRSNVWRPARSVFYLSMAVSGTGALRYIQMLWLFASCQAIISSRRKNHQSLSSPALCAARDGEFIFSTIFPSLYVLCFWWSTALCETRRRGLPLSKRSLSYRW